MKLMDVYLVDIVSISGILVFLNRNVYSHINTVTQ